MKVFFSIFSPPSLWSLLEDMVEAKKESRCMTDEEKRNNGTANARKVEIHCSPGQSNILEVK